MMANGRDGAGAERDRPVRRPSSELMRISDQG